VGWYIVIKTIKGHRYRYRQRTWRAGGRMRTESVYLGRDDGAGSGAGKKKPANRSKSLPVDTTQPVFVDEPAFIATLFDPEKKAAAFVKPWSKRYSAKKRDVVIDPRVFKVAIAMGLAATTRPWAGRRTSNEMSDGAWHIKSDNRLQMPDATRFVSAGEFHKVFFHELTHATRDERHVGRKPRFGGHSFSDEYCEEELVAEMSAQLVVRRLGIGDGDISQSAYYLQTYLRRCSDPTAARAWAEREAIRAADYLVATWQRVNTTK